MVATKIGMIVGVERREENGGEERNGKGFGYGKPPTAANPNGNTSLICVTHKHTRLSFPLSNYMCIYLYQFNLLRLDKSYPLTHMKFSLTYHITQHHSNFEYVNLLYDVTMIIYVYDFLVEKRKKI